MGQYVVDHYDINFLVSWLNEQSFTILEDTFKAFPFKIGLEELLLIFLNLFHHDTTYEQVYISNAIVQMWDEIMENTNNKESVIWDDMTTFFMKSLI